MRLLVQKYGGSSVGTPQRIRGVAERIARSRREGWSPVVVVSAMQGETDRLISLAHQVSPDPDEREMDMLLSSGERVAIALLAMALQAVGVPARSFTGRQVGIRTDSTHTRARIEHISAERLLETLGEGIVPVVAGFQGIDEKSDVTTLGRGGSDTTAVALAVALQAEICAIYTDVDGVYTADPLLVPGARRLDRVSYEEMLEMASLGARVLQTRSVEFAMKYRMPVRVLSSFTDGPGTLVTKEDNAMEQVVVSGITHDRNQAKITVAGVPDRPGIASRLFGPVADAAIVVDMIIQNVGQEGLTDISFTVPKTDAKKGFDLVRRVAGEIGAQDVHLQEEIAKVSIVGVGMRSHSGVAAKMFATLAKEGINIMMISTSEIKISCVIEEKSVERAVRALHDVFVLVEPKASNNEEPKASDDEEERNGARGPG